jgi:hypothetical protein
MNIGILQSDCTCEPSVWLTDNSSSKDLRSERDSSNPLRHFRAFRVKQVYEDDYLWDSTAVGRLEALVKTIPPIVTLGSIVVERGKAHFKGPPLVECPRCNSKLTRGTATLTFRHAPLATQQQQVEAWVCPCGEFYAPGKIAREAYIRAFGHS